MDNESKAILQTALAVRVSHPHATALEVLDLAMTDRNRSDPDFSDASTPAGDHTDPASPFGRLLRDAFAPEITDAELTERGGPSGESAFWVRWHQRVMEPFAERYRLWSAETDDDRWTTLVSAQVLKRWPHLAATDSEEIARRLALLPEWRSVAAEAAADAYVRQSEERNATNREHGAFQLALHIEGATPDDLARGVAAAQAVFDDTGVTPAKAARALFNRDGWDVRGFPEEAQPTEAEMQAAAVWEDAEFAATSACCAGWATVPVSAHLELRWRWE
ncbi:MAG: hypothetical protein EPN61_15310 [Burkholderiaceae bacterium]|nr:MAG: hypothetical protein EPN61_15310 [Burkholderiaceae bacterium]